MAATTSPSTALATRPAASPPVPGSGAPPEPGVETQVQRWGIGPLFSAFVAAGTLMYFGGLFAAWILSREAAGEAWLPENFNLDLYRGTTIALTALMISACVQWAVHAARNGDQRHTVIALALTTGLGLALADLAWFSLVKAGVGAGETAFTTLLYAVLGSLAIATLAASILALLALFRAIGGQFTPEEHQFATATALQWHGLTVIAVAVYLVVWVLK